MYKTDKNLGKNSACNNAPIHQQTRTVHTKMRLLKQVFPFNDILEDINILIIGINNKTAQIGSQFGDNISDEESIHTTL